MARNRADSPSRSEPGRGQRALRVLKAIVLCLGVCGAAWGYVRVRAYVEANLACPRSIPEVRLVDRPAWMNDTLAEQIVAAVRPVHISPATDRLLLEEMGGKLARNPWVRKVRQLRRLYVDSPGDTIEADCEYRTPTALVASRGMYILVDGEGVRLPEQFPATGLPQLMFASDGRVIIRIIEGVTALPPYQPGERWVGDDLQAGLDLAKLLYGRAVAEDVYRINVANFRGRRSAREPQIVLVTRYGTEVRWGEPVRQTFHAELSPVEKMERMARILRQYGRIDAGRPWIDIRLEKVLCPPEDNSMVQAAPGR